MRTTTKLLLAAVAGLGMSYNAAALDVSADITTDTTWTKAQSPIFLKDPILVKNGASLTIEAGVVVITLAADDGGIVVTRGSQIFVQGTAAEPVIMTSGNDVGTWAGSVVSPANAPFGADGLPDTADDVDVTAVTTVGNPKTGVHRQVDSEWRNLTVMGNGVISASQFDFDGNGTPDTRNDPDTGLPNPTVPNGVASAIMEGLNTGDGTLAEIAYGGGDDNDDSGTITYLSSRYTGRVLGAGDELNGYSFGALGRGTDISHIDLMNNVDDGIETWGGAVNYKYFNVWNVGDDSFDVDQGWRGKAQFGLIVQGYASRTAPSQGSGAGDNIFETDGAEQSNIQPRTTAAIYNVSAFGMPNGDGATTWRDNARVQYRNMLFCDIGEELVRLDNQDGDGGQGYGFGGTHAFFNPGGADIWDTSASTLPTLGAGGGAYAPANLYLAQDPDGKLAELRDSVIYDPDGLSDSGEVAFILGLLEGAGGAPASSGANANAYSSVVPVVKYDRSGKSASIDGKTYTLIAAGGLDPRPAVDAAKQSVSAAPADGFFTPAPYRGGFSPTNNWAEGWTAADAYGFFANTGTNAADPALGSITLAAKLNFPTVDGVFYTVYESADGVTFSPMATVEGDGGTVSVADLDDFDPSKLYKVEAQ